MEGSTTIEPKPARSSRFALASPAVRIAPSLFSADFSRLKQEVAAVESAGAMMLHLDVMDGHFAPNISFGVPVIASLRKCTEMFLDAHLMICEPKRYAEAFVAAGCDHITFHIEATEPRASARANMRTPVEPRAVASAPCGGRPAPNVHHGGGTLRARADIPDAQSVIDHIRSLGASVGVSLNPTTPVSAIESILDTVDMVLVMSVWPGFGGQVFISDVLSKVTELRQRLGERQRLEIDGGIDVTTIGPAAAAGADTFVAGTAVFGAPDPPAALARLQRLALDAAGERYGD